MYGSLKYFFIDKEHPPYDEEETFKAKIKQVSTLSRFYKVQAHNAEPKSNFDMTYHK